MRLLSSLLLGLALSLAAVPCAAGKAATYPGALPADVEGEFVVDVPAADLGNNDEDVAYGTLTAKGAEYAVVVPDALLRKSGLEAGGKVRATLDSEKRDFGFPVYRVTALQKL